MVPSWTLPPHWSWTTISAVADTSSGGTPSRDKPHLFGGDVSWVKSGELNDRLITQTEETITQEALDHSNAKLLPKGTPLVALYGATVGRTAMLGLEAATNQAVCAIQPIMKVCDARYVLLWMQSQRNTLIGLSAGGAQRNISQAIVRSFPFPLAPLPEQQAIVAAIETQFTRLDAAVAALKRIQANLRRYRAAVLKAACEGQLVPTEAALARQEGRPYEPASALLARILAERRTRWQAEHPGKHYKEPAAPDTSALPELPEGWCWATLGSMFDVNVGSTPSRQKLEYWHGDIPWVSSGEVAFRRIRRTKECISRAGFENSSTKLNPPGTVLLAMIGEGKTRGQAAVLDINAANNQNVAGIVVPKTPIPPEWVFYCLMQGYDSTRRSGSGGMQYALNLERVRLLVIPLAPLNEMVRIVFEVERLLSNVTNIESFVEKNLMRALSMRQSILQRAFTGQLVSPNNTESPV